MKIIPKFQQGKQFDSFFTIYKPVGDPQQQKATVGSSRGSRESSSTKGELTEKDFFDMIKDIDGLPNEIKDIVGRLVAQFQMSNLTGIDSANLATQYLQNLYQIKIAAQNKETYDSILKNVEERGALHEPAITPDGKLVVQDKSGKVQAVSLEQYNKGQYHVLTVSNLANMRKYDPSLAYNQTAFDIISNSTGFEEVQNILDSAKSTLGNNKYSETGISDKRALLGLQAIQNMSEEDKIAILQQATDGTYEYSSENKTNIQQVQSLIKYMRSVLPKRVKVWAAYKLGMSNEEEAANALVTQYLSGRISTEQSFTITPPKQNTNGQTSNNSNQSVLGKINLNMPGKLIAGYGDRQVFTLNPGSTNYSYLIESTALPFTSKEDKAIGPNATLQDIATGNFSGMLDLNNVSMGGKLINPGFFKGIISLDGKANLVDFPIDVEAYNRGVIVPAISREIIENKQKAAREIIQLKVNLNDKESIKQNYDTINEIYRKYGLPDMYDSQGNYTGLWKQFIVTNGVADSNILGLEPLEDNPLLQEVTDDNLIESLKEITFNKNFKGGVRDDDEFFQGTIWIPVNSDYNSVITGTTGQEALELDTSRQVRDIETNWKSGRQPQI